LPGTSVIKKTSAEGSDRNKHSLLQVLFKSLILKSVDRVLHGANWNTSDFVVSAIYQNRIDLNNYWITDYKFSYKWNANIGPWFFVSGYSVRHGRLPRRLWRWSGTAKANGWCYVISSTCHYVMCCFVDVLMRVTFRQPRVGSLLMFV